MFNTMFTKARLGVATVALGAVAAVAPMAAIAGDDMITVVDVAGRSVTVKHGVERVILGEGRMMYSVGVLDHDDPFGRIVGWKDDMIKFDPDAFRKYQAKFPEVNDIPNFGSPYAGDFSIENAIAVKADLVILNLGKLFQAEESGVVEKLEKAGIPVIFIDYRMRPLHNTVPSILMMGRVFAKEDVAQEFADFYMQQMRRITNVTAEYDAEDRPLVFIDRAAGIKPEFCCNTFGGANYGKFVDEAGGTNWGSAKFRGFAGAVNFETIIDIDPDIIIGTGANWSEARPDAIAVNLGYEATEEATQKSIQGLAARDGWETLRAVKEKKFYSIYHQFYNSPYHFIALQQLAKWLHPEDFEDLDPEATFKEVHDRFLAVDMSGVFWTELK